MKITVIGLGYVGLSLEYCFLKIIMLLHTIRIKKKLITTNKKSQIQDIDINNFLSNKVLNFSPTNNKEKAFQDSDFYYLIFLAIIQKQDSLIQVAWFHLSKIF